MNYLFTFALPVAAAAVALPKPHQNPTTELWAPSEWPKPIDIANQIPTKPKWEVRASQPN